MLGPVDLRSRQGLIPRQTSGLGFDAVLHLSTRPRQRTLVHRSSSRPTPDALTARLFLRRSPPRLLTAAARVVCGLPLQGGRGGPPAQRPAPPSPTQHRINEVDLLRAPPCCVRGTRNRWPLTRSIAGRAKRNDAGAGRRREQIADGLVGADLGVAARGVAKPQLVSESQQSAASPFRGRRLWRTRQPPSSAGPSTRPADIGGWDVSATARRALSGCRVPRGPHDASVSRPSGRSHRFQPALRTL